MQRFAHGAEIGFESGGLGGGDAEGDGKLLVASRPSIRPAAAVAENDPTVPVT